MKKRALILSLVLATSVTACCFTGCSNNSDSGSEQSSTASVNNPNVQSEDEDTENSEDINTQPSEEESESTDSVDPATVDYSKVDLTIEYGDYEAINTLMNEMQEGKYDGKVIKIDGISSKMVTSCSIMEDKGEGEKIGVGYAIQGEENLDNYPTDGARVELVGVVVSNEYAVRSLSVPKDQLNVIKEPTT